MAVSAAQDSLRSRTLIPQLRLSPLSLPLNQTDQYDWDGLRDQVVKLKAQGHSVEYIARITGRSTKLVTKLLKSDFGERFAERQKIVMAHAIELDYLKALALQRITRDGEKWDRRDAEVYLKIRAEQAKLLGTDQPTQHQHQVTVELAELSNEELDAQLRQFGVALPEGFLSLPAPQEQIEDAEFTALPVEATLTNDQAPSPSG